MERRKIKRGKRGIVIHSFFQLISIDLTSEQSSDGEVSSTLRIACYHQVAEVEKLFDEDGKGLDGVGVQGGRVCWEREARNQEVHARVYDEICQEFSEVSRDLHIPMRTDPKKKRYKIEKEKDKQKKKRRVPDQ